MTHAIGFWMTILGGVSVVASLILNRDEILGRKPHATESRLDYLLDRAQRLQLELDITYAEISREAGSLAPEGKWNSSNV